MRAARAARRDVRRRRGGRPRRYCLVEGSSVPVNVPGTSVPFDSTPQNETLYFSITSNREVGTTTTRPVRHARRLCDRRRRRRRRSQRTRRLGRRGRPGRRRNDRVVNSSRQGRRRRRRRSRRQPLRWRRRRGRRGRRRQPRVRPDPHNYRSRHTNCDLYILNRPNAESQLALSSENRVARPRPPPAALWTPLR